MKEFDDAKEVDGCIPANGDGDIPVGWDWSWDWKGDGLGWIAWNGDGAVWKGALVVWKGEVLAWNWDTDDCVDCADRFDVLNGVPIVI